MLKKIGVAIGIIVVICIITLIIVYSEPKLAVICYHGVMTKEEIETVGAKGKPWNISVDNFEEEMKYLHDHNYKTLTMEEFSKWKKGEIDVPFKSVLVTFDDGLLSNYYYALPILKKYNINATIFVIAQRSEEIGEDENSWQSVANSYMSRAQLDEIINEYPNVELHCHTYDMHKKIDTKPAVFSYTQEQMNEDLDKYEQYMGKTDYIAYPFGATNEAYVNALKEHGYKYGFLLKDNKKATRNDDDFYINRINLSTDKDLFHFAVRLLLPY